MKSRAVVVGRFPDYTVREFEVPACGAEGLIVKVAAAPFGRRGLVDLRLDGAMDGRLRDFIPGGEIIGRVVSAPPAAAEAWKVSEGDMVYIEPNIVCGFCKPCLTGNYSVCREQLRYGSFPLAERPGLLTGGFSEYVSVLPNSRVHKLPEDLPPESAVLLGTAERALRAVIKRGGGGLGKRMLVLGCLLYTSPSPRDRG